MLGVVNATSRDEEEMDTGLCFSALFFLFFLYIQESGSKKTDLAFGYLSVTTTKSSSYSSTLPSGFFSGVSMYMPSPSRGSQPFEGLMAFFGASGESEAGTGGFGFLDCDMSSVTAL